MSAITGAGSAVVVIMAPASLGGAGHGGGHGGLMRVGGDAAMPAADGAVERARVGTTGADTARTRGTRVVPPPSGRAGLRP